MPSWYRMSTQCQINANRCNSLKSTGAVTPDGKKKVALNALVHGMCSRQVVVPGLGETQEDYDRHVNQYLDYYRPTDPIERDLLIGIATEAHRLQRLNIIEAATLEVAAFFRGIRAFADLWDRPPGLSSPAR